MSSHFFNTSFCSFSLSSERLVGEKGHFSCCQQHTVPVIKYSFVLHVISIRKVFRQLLQRRSHYCESASKPAVASVALLHRIILHFKARKTS